MKNCGTDVSVVPCCEDRLIVTMLHFKFNQKKCRCLREMDAWTRLTTLIGTNVFFVSRPTQHAWNCSDIAGFLKMNLVREQRHRKLGRNHHKLSCSIEKVHQELPQGVNLTHMRLGQKWFNPELAIGECFFREKSSIFLPFLNECIFLNLRETLRLGRFGYWKFMRLQFGDNVAVAGPVAPILPRQLLVLLPLPPPPPLLRLWLYSHQYCCVDYHYYKDDHYDSIVKNSHNSLWIQKS